MTTPITLKWYEIVAAANIGVLRRVSSLKNKCKDRMLSTHGDSWQVDIEGACAELACAKVLDVHCPFGVFNFDISDLSVSIQVRHSQGSNNRLIIRDRDSDKDIWVLVVGAAPNYSVCGWIYGKDGKNKEFISDPNKIGSPAYFVPQRALRPMSELKRMILEDKLKPRRNNEEVAAVTNRIHDDGLPVSSPCGTRGS